MFWTPCTICVTSAVVRGTLLINAKSILDTPYSCRNLVNIEKFKVKQLK
jgi:hypothetical protein